MNSPYQTGIKIKDIIYSGKIETTDLVDIDTALVKTISNILDSIHVSNPEHQRNKRLADFINRPSPADKVAIGQYETPKEFIAALANRIKSKRNESGDRLDEQNAKVSLPFIFVARDPAIRFADDPSYDQKDFDTLSDDETGEFIASVDCSAVLLGYSVYFVGWNDLEVSQLAAHYGMWLRQKDTSHVFTYKTAFSGIPVELPIELIERHSATFESASGSISEDKVRALSLNITAQANIMRARYGEDVSKELIASRGDVIE